MATETEATPGETRVYRRPMAANWWTRRRNYFLYVVREFTALPLALWLLWFLWEVQRAQVGTYHPPASIAFVVFSVIVLLFALYHSITFLSLAGSILHFRIFDKPVPSRLVVLAQFAIWAVASAVVAAVLIGLGTDT
jgi:fumarate reductase subunit C